MLGRWHFRAGGAGNRTQEGVALQEALLHKWLPACPSSPYFCQTSLMVAPGNIVTALSLRLAPFFTGASLWFPSYAYETHVAHACNPSTQK